MLIVGLTGGIAGGKSTLAAMLQKKGAIVIDADQIARQEMEPGKPAYHAVVDRFGKGLLDPTGRIDRRALANVVFSSPSKVKLLNELTHGHIIERARSMLDELKRKEKDGVVIIEVPLLIESGFESEVDKVVVISASEGKRKARAAAQGLSARETRDRMDSQISDRRRLEFADYVIENNGGMEELEVKAQQLWEQLKSCNS